MCKRRFIFIVSGLGLLGLLVLASLSFAPSLATRYAPGYSPRAFKSLQPGMTYGEITNILGLPVNYTIIGQPDSSGRYGPQDAKDVESIPDFIVRRDDALVMLCYTEKRVDLIYESVELFLAHGKLTITRRYFDWDD